MSIACSTPKKSDGEKERVQDGEKDGEKETQETKQGKSFENL